MPVRTGEEEEEEGEVMGETPAKGVGGEEEGEVMGEIPAKEVGEEEVGAGEDGVQEVEGAGVVEWVQGVEGAQAH